MDLTSGAFTNAMHHICFDNYNAMDDARTSLVLQELSDSSYSDTLRMMRSLRHKGGCLAGFAVAAFTCLVKP